VNCIFRQGSNRGPTGVQQGFSSGSTGVQEAIARAKRRHPHSHTSILSVKITRYIFRIHAWTQWAQRHKNGLVRGRPRAASAAVWSPDLKARRKPRQTSERFYIPFAVSLFEGRSKSVWYVFKKITITWSLTMSWSRSRARQRATLLVSKIHWIHPELNIRCIHEITRGCRSNIESV
jgi:hypothetical protein